MQYGWNQGCEICCKISYHVVRISQVIRVLQISSYISEFQILKQLQKILSYTHVQFFVVYT